MTGACVTAALSISMSSAKAESTGCPPGFSDPGSVTLKEFLTAPRHVAGLEAGVYSKRDLTARFHFIDADDNGRICIKAVSNLEGSSDENWRYFYLSGDD
jgi:hypothetical protein